MLKKLDNVTKLLPGELRGKPGYQVLLNYRV
jgi:hypothetical protein